MFKYSFLSIFICCIVLSSKYIKSLDNTNSTCDDWDTGMKGSKMSDARKCNLIRPKVCQEIIYDNLFDISSWLLETCELTRNDSKEIIQKYSKIKHDFTRIAYPRTENWSFLPRSTFDNYKKSVWESIQDISNYQTNKIKEEKFEVWVDFPHYKPPKVNIEVIKDEKLAFQRDKLFSNNNSEMQFKNIFILFVDSVSRNHFKRKLPKLYNWIEQFYNSEDDVKYEAFQFFKYHATGTWTNANLYPLYFGKPYTQFNGDYIIKYFKEKGYVSGSITNQCSREFVDIHNERRQWTNWDHEFTSLFCDPNYAAVDTNWHYVKGPYGSRKKCLYGKYTLEYAIDYTQQFLGLYKDQAKVTRLGTIDGHEGTGEVVKYNDQLFLDFVEDFERKGYLDDTLFIVMSDHGYTLPGFHTSNQSEDHQIEVTLPFLSVILPKNIKNFKQIRDNLKFNENSVITPYDLHSTLVGILNDAKIGSSKFGMNILENKLDRDNVCKDHGIKAEWCRCQN